MPEPEVIETLIDPIYDAAVAPERWPRFLATLAPRIDAKGVYLILRFPDEDDPGALFSVGADPAYDEAYREHFWSKDPWRPLAHRLAEGEVQCGYRVVPEEELVRTEFYDEWMRPQGLHHPLTASLQKQGARPLSGLRGFRPPGTQPFGPREIDLLRALVPHLQRALVIHRQLRGAEMRRSAAVEALDRAAGGVILLDQEGRPLDVNRRAEELLAQRDGLFLDRDGPSAAEGSETAELRARVAEAVRADAAKGRGAGGAVSLTRPSGRSSLLAVVTPLGRASSALFDRRAAAAIFLSDPETHDRRTPERLRQLYGLTAMEAEVASRIAWGARLPDVAAAHRVSVHTARGHLKQVFAKTGVHRQADLVRLLLAGPAALRLE